jgi:hypothetical protein
MIVTGQKCGSSHVQTTILIPTWWDWGKAQNTSPEIKAQAEIWAWDLTTTKNMCSTHHKIGSKDIKWHLSQIFYSISDTTFSLHSLLLMVPSCLCVCLWRIPYMCVYKPHLLTRIFLPKLGCGLYTELKNNLDPPRKSRYHIDNWAHDASILCCETPVETVSSLHHRLSIDSQKSEDSNITDRLS